MQKTEEKINRFIMLNNMKIEGSHSVNFRNSKGEGVFIILIKDKLFNDSHWTQLFMNEIKLVCERAQLKTIIFRIMDHGKYFEEFAFKLLRIVEDHKLIVEINWVCNKEDDGCISYMKNLSLIFKKFKFGLLKF